MMTPARLACLALPALVAVTGCVRHPPPATSQIIVQPSAQPVATAVIAPQAPPPPQSELVPTPPPGAGAVVWQPGHWLLSGNNWVWQSGQYVPPPPGQTTWVPGRWLQQPTGGWMWAEGHWA
jgi:WXXGXW repeat (2 copies)